jgi:hypothetical protein
VASDPGTDTAWGMNWFMAAIGAVFLVMGARHWHERPRRGEAASTPKWMASITSVPPGRAFVLGTALSGANPKNLALARIVADFRAFTTTRGTGASRSRASGGPGGVSLKSSCGRTARRTVGRSMDVQRYRSR